VEPINPTTHGPQRPDRVLVGAFMGPLPVKLPNFQRWGRGVIVKFTFAVVNTDATITHSLGRIPVAYWVVRCQKGGVVYDGTNLGTDWTTTTIILRNTVASDVDWIYIL
jgi:hypothetical protein